MVFQKPNLILIYFLNLHVIELFLSVNMDYYKQGRNIPLTTNFDVSLGS
uniref:Uncharacterized protein n=1 Tax=Lepeophtheirus salmonis TaxID=72036 RepID=A0A0K2SY76_LEPSM